MSFVVVGLNHKTAPVELLERVAISDDALPKALDHLLGYDHVVEGAILSTCNRVEVFAVVTKFHGGAQDMRNFLAEFCHLAPEEFSDRLYTYHDEGAVRHLFRVAAGVDSMIIGESEILGQVRRAFTRASELGTAHRTLTHAFRRALNVGRRARAETAIARNPVSISSAAVELAGRALPGGSLAGRRVLVLGAGKMGGLALRALERAGTGEVTVMSRTDATARDLAESRGVGTRAMGDLERAVAETDIVICSTNSQQTVLDRGLIEAALRRRTRPAPVVIVDIAVPRDVDPSAAELDHVVLRDIDDLRGVVEAGMGSRIEEISKVEEIVARETERFFEVERAGEMRPAVAALVARADEVLRAELERALRSLPELSAEQREVVDHLSRRIVAKLMHDPLQRARELGTSARGTLYLDAVRELIELDDESSA
jgi:glutamyl-tRNA reductase